MRIEGEITKKIALIFANSPNKFIQEEKDRDQ